MSDTKLSLAILQRISEFLAELPEEHLADLANGKARLTFIPTGATEPHQPTTRRSTRAKASRAAAPKVDMSETRDALAGMDSREEGREFLDKFRVEQELRPLARLLGISSSGTKDILIARIVERTIGGRLNSAAIRHL